MFTSYQDSEICSVCLEDVRARVLDKLEICSTVLSKNVGMVWMNGQFTTQPEDVAYSLLGFLAWVCLSSMVKVAGGLLEAM